ncbi:hypothetical protein K461DRAFT_318695 [Myriangium duriaei CBS 260.36]|uniref:VPS37 C-terminal domain-containing protein n=1 Tax=Myriangium duriaei CBS 260.36 TaxID=1168546 RepID=A0A9P4MIK5_9PEZI|nr:hypothetical protein K461DRAFT_318695 [Myriangium duriaei CBS 260.36]
MAYSATPSYHHRPSGSYDYNSATPPPPPPKPSSGTQTPSRGPPLPPPPTQGFDPVGDRASGDFQESNFPAQQNVTLPEPGWLPPGLTDKTTQDLHYLLEHPELQTALLDNPATSHPSIAQSQAPLKQILESNVVLSDSLLQLEAQLTTLRSSTQSRLLGLRALEQQHRTKLSETENELKEFSPMALYQRLNASAQEQDSLVRGIEDSFLDENGMASDREVQDFVRRLREAKKTAFLRNERKMRWDEGRVGGWR